ncbi:hypothetical protein BC835DRAFT_1420505 [Cytidiella melzeri]|nr:hypothetical protein BC835DRAFT_1420505 [Cytidiella melzeri]
MRFFAIVALIFVATACPGLSAPANVFNVSGRNISNDVQSSPFANVASSGNQNRNTGRAMRERPAMLARTTTVVDNMVSATNTSPTPESVSNPSRTRQSPLMDSNGAKILNGPHERDANHLEKITTRSLSVHGTSILPRNPVPATWGHKIGFPLLTIITAATSWGIHEQYKNTDS